jgi:hypothetical protein
MDTDCQKILSKYYGHIPAIVTPDKDIEMTKRRFLLPQNETFGYSASSIRKHIKVKPSEAVFFLIDDKMIDMRQNVGEFYEKYKVGKHPDRAYLFIHILKERTFGKWKNE